MKKITIVAVITSFAVSNNVSADSGYETTWAFEVDYPNHQKLTDENPTHDGELPMPVGSAWRCSRIPLGGMKLSPRSAGFSCSVRPHYEAGMRITAQCDSTKTGNDFSQVVIDTSGNGKFEQVHLLVFCETKRK